MSDTFQSLEEIRDINNAFPHTKAIEEWKRSGKKVIGWLCTYVPEEIIYAAGMLPIVVGGDFREQAMADADAYMYHNNCSAVRSCLQRGLRGEYDFLDGLIVGSTCDGIRRLHDIWSSYLPTPFTHILDVPHKLTERAGELYRSEVLQLKERIEDFFQVDITPQSLQEAIGVYNKTRELLGRLYELREREAPPISGWETLEVMNASKRMPKEQFNWLLERLLHEIDSSKRAIAQEVRLMLTGSMLDSPDFLKSLEDLGCIVVVDELCTGVRYWWDQVDTSGTADPLEAICRRYLHKFPCARMIPADRRYDLVLELAKKYNVHGVITEVIRYCALYANDQPLLKQTLERQGLPVFELDVEYGMPMSGQVGTRVQAFLEMLAVRM